MSPYGLSRPQRVKLKCYEILFAYNIHFQLQRHAKDIIEAEWCIYASVNITTIGLNNGLSPGWRPPII